MDDPTRWHLAKGVPLTFILGIVIQTTALVWYVSSLDSNVEANTREIARHEIRIVELEKTSIAQAIMLGRIDENIKAIRGAVETIAAPRKSGGQ
jgi:hypothetical protein